MRDPMGPVHTPANAVPPLDDELAGLLDDTAGVHAGIDLIRQGLHLLALDRLTTDQTQTVLHVLADDDGLDILTGIALLVQRLTDPDTNPALRSLPLALQKTVRHLGEQHGHETSYLNRQPLADAIGLIDQDT
ncbi:hypothetical protein [Streptomyces sp. NRRL F-5135]|uniref:hypothetical protein n=1 Tax=Streptomyces sp. NRRL F-5135 TaxID=1463858 RepID=UPI0004C737A7|nr:hypothetical protein [Streptomyces sp. NRRL F-5135]